MAAGVKCDPVSWGVTGQMYVTSVSRGGLHRWTVWYVEGTAVVWCPRSGRGVSWWGPGSDSCWGTFCDEVK